MSTSIDMGEASGRLFEVRKTFDPELTVWNGKGKLHAEKLLGEQVGLALLVSPAVPFPIELVFREHHRNLFGLLPYELITRRDVQFCRNGTRTLLRTLDLASDRQKTSAYIRFPLHILIVTASPQGMATIPVPDIMGKLSDKSGVHSDGQWIHYPLVRFCVIQGSNTAEQMRSVLKESYFSIVVIVAHGEDAQVGQDGVVYFEDDRGMCKKVDGNELASMLSVPDKSPALVVLASCLTNRETEYTPAHFGAVAWQLLVSGIPSVVAMQMEVSIKGTINALRSFFDTLLTLGSLDRAVGEMRRILNGDEWFAPVLSTHRGFDRQLFDEDSRALLEEIKRVNERVNQLMNGSVDHVALVELLGQLPPEFYPLLDKRDMIAAHLVEHVRTELGVFV